MKPRKTHMDVLKANRRGSRDAEIENSTGWTNVLKVHPNNKRYKRNQKHKGSGNTDLFLCPEFSRGPTGKVEKFFRNKILI